MRDIDKILLELQELIGQSSFKELESDTLEIKPVPADGGSWRERQKSVNAFLNTRGGILVLGVKEEGQGAARKYVFKGYREDAEPKLKELTRLFTDRENREMDLTSCFPPPEIREFLDGRIALVYVDELSSEQKFCFLNGDAFKRVLTRDDRITDSEINAQEEYKQEIWNAREIQPVVGARAEDLDLDRLNEYIQLLNRTVKIETIKADLQSAKSFLERKSFLRGDSVTTLGVLVCGRHPGDLLGFRCQLNGYVDMPGEIARDKQDFSDNVLPLMEGGLSFILRNIQVGVSSRRGGTAQPQYPEPLLRETVNNALAHRDYSIDRQVIIAIKPGEHIEIRNPGSFRPNLLIELQSAHGRVIRILPEAKPRNPKLADVLRVYRKWEGRGIGMATLVNLCLENQIDLPYYRLHQDEVRLYLCAGSLLDDKMERMFDAFDRFISDKLAGSRPTDVQKLVLSYVIKSEWANERQRHTILLTADNNHYEELVNLKYSGLIGEHPASPELYPVYMAAPELMRKNWHSELLDLFGSSYTTLAPQYKDVLEVAYLHGRFSSLKPVSAKRVSQYLWAHQERERDDIEEFDRFYRSVRYTINMLTRQGFLTKLSGGGPATGYVLNGKYKAEHLVYPE